MGPSVGKESKLLKISTLSEMLIVVLDCGASGMCFRECYSKELLSLTSKISKFYRVTVVSLVVPASWLIANWSALTMT